MPFSRRLAVGDTWYVCLHGLHRCAESSVVETVEILHISDHTVQLRLKPDMKSEPEWILRYKTKEIEFVEFVSSKSEPRLKSIQVPHE